MVVWCVLRHHTHHIAMHHSTPHTPQRTALHCTTPPHTHTTTQRTTPHHADRNALHHGTPYAPQRTTTRRAHHQVPYPPTHIYTAAATPPSPLPGCSARSGRAATAFLVGTQLLTNCDMHMSSSCYSQVHMSSSSYSQVHMSSSCYSQVHLYLHLHHHRHRQPQ